MGAVSSRIKGRPGRLSFFTFWFYVQSLWPFQSFATTMWQLYFEQNLNCLKWYHEQLPSCQLHCPRPVRHNFQAAEGLVRNETVTFKV